MVLKLIIEFNLLKTSSCSVNEASETTTTTIDQLLAMNGGEQTVIARNQIECQREFTISSETDLMNGGTLTSGITADLATMKIFSLSERNEIKLNLFVLFIFSKRDRTQCRHHW